MLKTLFYSLVCVPLGLLCGAAKAKEGAMGASAYDYSFTSIVGEPLPLSQFKGKPVLVVNTASECGFTKQYKGLEALWEKYKDRGLVVIAVPSNDFGGQEPGSEKTIKEFCEVKFGVSFYMSQKEHVVGDEAHPFYKYAREKLGLLAAPKWNFHKYLIGPDGQLVDWYASTTEPTSPKITGKIESLLP